MNRAVVYEWLPVTAGFMCAEHGRDKSYSRTGCGERGGSVVVSTPSIHVGLEARLVPRAGVLAT